MIAFLLSLLRWLTSGVREVFALWCEGRAVQHVWHEVEVTP